MKRKLGFSALILAGAVALGACSSGGDDAAEPSTSAQSEATSSTSEAAQALSKGDSFDVPCSGNDDTTCMTVKINDIIDDVHCASTESKKGKFVAVEISASMPEGADDGFTSPFRSMPWRVSTADNKINNARAEVSCDDGSYLNLMDEFPGYSADGTAFLDVSKDTNMLHFKATNEVSYKIKVESGGEAEPSSQEPTNEASPKNDPAQERAGDAAQPAPQPKSGADSGRQQQGSPHNQEGDAPQNAGDAPVVGITQAPGVENPHPLDKTVASCGDPSNQQPGTTYFTDGTTGWTQQCASQMAQ